MSAELTLAHMRFLARTLHFHIKDVAATQKSSLRSVEHYLTGDHRKHCSSPQEADRMAMRIQGECDSRGYRLKLAEESLVYFLEQLNAKPCTCDTSYDEKAGKHRGHIDTCFARPIK